MSTVSGVTLYSADAQLATATGATKNIRLTDNQTLAYVQIYIEADALTTSATKVEIQGRANSSANWVTLDKADHSTEASVTASSGAEVNVIFPIQAMPQMRAKHSGTYAATEGNDIDVFLVAPGTTATRADS